LNHFRRKRILELGSGTGIIGIALGLLGGEVRKRPEGEGEEEEKETLR